MLIRDLRPIVAGGPLGLVHIMKQKVTSTSKEELAKKKKKLKNIIRAGLLAL